MCYDRRTCPLIRRRAGKWAGGRTDGRAGERAGARPTDPPPRGGGRASGREFLGSDFRVSRYFPKFSDFQIFGFQIFSGFFSHFRIFWFSDIFPEFSDFRIFRFSDILLEFSDFGIFALKNSSGVRSFPSMALKRSRAHLLNKVPTPMIPKYCSGITRVLFGCRPFAMVHAVHNQL